MLKGSKSGADGFTVSELWAWNGLDPFMDSSLFSTRSADVVAPVSELSTKIVAAFGTFKQIMGANGIHTANCNSHVESMLKQSRLPRFYDREMLSILVGIFTSYIPPVFTSFADFELEEESMPALVLAMAALGAVFSNVKERETIGKALYTDSQRMTVDTATNTSRVPLRQQRSHAKTIILLELFAFCSGEKRAVDLADGLHYALYQALQSLCNRQSGPDHSDSLPQQTFNIITDALLLESYHTVLLQQSPLISPSSLPGVVLPPSRGQSETHRTLLSYHLGMLNGPIRSTQQRASYLDIASLATSAHLCRGIYRPYMYEAVGRIRQPEVLCSALTAFAGELNPRQLFLCHTTIITLYAPMDDLRDMTFRTIAGIAVPTVLKTLLENWQKSHDAEIAVEHAADVMILAAQRILEGGEEVDMETPHDAYCVYIAAILLFHATDHSLAAAKRGYDCSTALETAIRVLSQLKALVAVKMKQDLCILRDVYAHL